MNTSSSKSHVDRIQQQRRRWGDETCIEQHQSGKDTAAVLFSNLEQRCFCSGTDGDDDVDKGCTPSTLNHLGVFSSGKRLTNTHGKEGGQQRRRVTDSDVSWMDVDEWTSRISACRGSLAEEKQRDDMSMAVLNQTGRNVKLSKLMSDMGGEDEDNEMHILKEEWIRGPSRVRTFFCFPFASSCSTTVTGTEDLCFYRSPWSGEYQRARQIDAAYSDDFVSALHRPDEEELAITSALTSSRSDKIVSLEHSLNDVFRGYGDAYMRSAILQVQHSKGLRGYHRDLSMEILEDEDERQHCVTTSVFVDDISDEAHVAFSADHVLQIVVLMKCTTMHAVDDHDDANATDEDNAGVAGTRNNNKNKKEVTMEDNETLFDRAFPSSFFQNVTSSSSLRQQQSPSSWTTVHHFVIELVGRTADCTVSSKVKLVSNQKRKQKDDDDDDDKCSTEVVARLSHKHTESVMFERSNVRGGEEANASGGEVRNDSFTLSSSLRGDGSGGTGGGGGSNADSFLLTHNEEIVTFVGETVQHIEQNVFIPHLRATIPRVSQYSAKYLTQEVVKQQAGSSTVPHSEAKNEKVQKDLLSPTTRQQQQDQPLSVKGSRDSMLQELKLIIQSKGGIAVV